MGSSELRCVSSCTQTPCSDPALREPAEEKQGKVEEEGKERKEKKAHGESVTER